jgi:hypothetical protein
LELCYLTESLEDGWISAHAIKQQEREILKKTRSQTIVITEADWDAKTIRARRPPRGFDFALRKNEPPAPKKEAEAEPTIEDIDRMIAAAEGEEEEEKEDNGPAEPGDGPDI